MMLNKNLVYYEFRVKWSVVLLFIFGIILSPALSSDESSFKINVGSGRERRQLSTEMIKKLTNLKSRNTISNGFDQTRTLLERIKRNDDKTEKLESGAAEIKAYYYINTIFKNYGDVNGLSLYDFDMLLKRIGLVKMTGHANITESHDQDKDDVNYIAHNQDHDDHNNDIGQDDHNDHHPDRNSHNIQKREVTVAVNPSKVAKENTDESKEKCLTSRHMLEDYEIDRVGVLNDQDFLYLCPALIHQLDQDVCNAEKQKNVDKDNEVERALVWVYTMVSVLIISLCALFGILCIPRKGRTSDKLILQFLIALAMGSMSGDGMLHLIPHAMSPHHEDEEGHDGDDHEGHLDAMFKGLLALIGVYLFFFLERGFAVYRSRSSAGRRGAAGVPLNSTMTDGHGHSHGHGDDETDDTHHNANQGFFSCTSLAMMIIVGDMFHNFCDGLAIGAAFTASVSLGLSTSIAVFCHELPHEIGDFAVLITSGMSRKKAIFFNLLSTVPCFFGAAIGLELGTLGDLSLWIFAMVGGMFMYIALVDLVPEMTRAYEDTTGPWKWYMVLHCLGMFSGVVIMLILGIYEEDLQQMLT